MNRSLALIAILAFVVPGVHAQEKATAAWSYDDPSGDVAPGGAAAGTPAIPDGAYTGYLDVRHITIEDPDEIELTIRWKNEVPFRALAAGELIVLGAPRAFHDVTFVLPGTAAQEITGTVSVASYYSEVGVPSFPGVVQDVGLCLYPIPIDTCTFPDLFLEWEILDGELLIHVPKVELTQQGSLGQNGVQLPSQLHRGDELRNVRVRAWTRLTTEDIQIANVGEVEDQVTASGGLPNYRLSHASAASDLRVTVEQIGLVAGEENSVLVRAENLADRKRLINWSAEVVEADGTWSVRPMTSSTLRSHEATNVTLRITPPAAGDGAPPFARVLIRATVVTESDVIGIADHFFIASKPLDKGASKFLAKAFPSTSPLGAVPLDIARFTFMFLSRIENDPRADPANKVQFSAYGGGAGLDLRADLPAIDGIPNPVRFTAPTFQGTAVIDAPVDWDGEVQAQVLANGAFLASATAPASLKRGVNEVALTFTRDPTIERLTPADSLEWAITIHRDGIDAIPFAFLSIADTFDLLPDKSWFELPVERERLPPPDPDLPHVALTAAEDREGFANPGRHVVFEADLRTDEDAALDVTLAVENGTQAWPAMVQPGTAFRIAPNETIRLGVVIEVPAAAKEGDTFAFNLVTRESGTGRPLATLPLKAIVTTGVDVEDEAFQAHEEDVARVKHEAKSPGPGVGIVLGALAAMCASLRRRAR